VFGALFFALSHSAFYWVSRETAASIENESARKGRPYFVLNLTLNIALALGPPIGGLAMTLVGGRILCPTLSLLFLLAAVLLWSHVGARSSAGSVQVDSGSVPTNRSEETVKTYALDLVRLTSVVLPIGVMSALLPLRMHDSGSSAVTFGVVFGLGGAIAVAIQLLGTLIRPHAALLLRAIDGLGLLAATIMLVSLGWKSAPIVWMFLCWNSIVAIQVPIMEQLVFAIRQYSGQRRARMFLLDGAASFAGPFAAQTIGV